MNDQPAFPTGIITDGKGKIIGGSNGMTLRDYFAAKAMQGFLAAKAWHPDFNYPADFNFDAGKRAADAVSEAAYKYADQMLKAREQ
jgi:hypothetical protein